MDFKKILTKERIREMREQRRWLDTLLTDRFDQILASKADDTAIVEYRHETAKEHRYTFGEIHERANRIAANLLSAGIRKGDVVSLQLPNWWHFAAVYLACVRTGAVLNALMPIFRERELEYMLGFAESKFLIVPQQFRGHDYPAMLDALRPRLPQLEKVYVVGAETSENDFDACLLSQPELDEKVLQKRFSAQRPDPNDVTEIMFTSGTTGTPKGVMHTANTLICMAEMAKNLFNLNRHDVVLMGSPLAHHTGFMYAMVMSLYHGLKCVLMDAWQPEQAARLVAQERASLTLGATPFLSDIVDHPGVAKHDLSSLRLFLCGGAPIPRVLVERARTVHPNMYVMSAWGMTEMGIATATRRHDPEEKSIETDGCVVPGQSVRVVDEAGNPVAAGEEGRLQSRCATSFVGYLKRPEDYGVDQDFWFETGDNARMDVDGYIRITGRSKDIIIRGGENIPVAEIEELLYRHPAIEDAQVVSMPDTRLGERACAFVSLHDKQTLDFAGMVDYLAANQLSRSYWPERLEIIDVFPRTASGKIQKFALREMASNLKPMQRKNK